MFGWDWDFEIIDEKILIEAKEIVVKGKLTCRSNGRTIVKMQYGNKDIAFKKNKPQTAENVLSIGNDLKSASTDALKKCASEIGIASDIYNKEDFKEVQVETEKHTFEQLKKLYELKKDYILSKDLVHIKRVIDKEETQSYNKTFNFLNKL